jgi:hypothetical protein
MKWYKLASLIGPLYHGTKTVFEDFDPEKKDPDSLYGPGFYFTDAPDVASGYAISHETINKKFLTEEDMKWFMEDHPNLTLMETSKETNTGIRGMLPEYEQISANFYDSTKYFPNVVPVYLNIESPFDVDNDRLTPEQLKEMGWDKLYGSGMVTGVGTGDVKRIIQNNPSKATELHGWLIQFGYDGITHVGGELTGTSPHHVWIAFDISQIVPKYSERAKQT